MSQKGPGRPTMGKSKTVVRSVSANPEIELFLKEHPEVNASDVFRNAMCNLMSEKSKSAQKEVGNTCRR